MKINQRSFWSEQPWLCVTLRFPVLAGLKLPEDEIVEIRCKQQDRTVAEKKDLDFDGEYVYLFVNTIPKIKILWPLHSFLDVAFAWQCCSWFHLLPFYIYLSFSFTKSGSCESIIFSEFWQLWLIGCLSDSQPKYVLNSKKISQL